MDWLFENEIKYDAKLMNTLYNFSRAVTTFNITNNTTVMLLGGVIKLPIIIKQSSYFIRWVTRIHRNKELKILISDEEIIIQDIDPSLFIQRSNWSKFNEFVEYDDFIFIYHIDTVYNGILSINKKRFIKGDYNNFILFIEKKGLKCRRNQMN